MAADESVARAVVGGALFLFPGLAWSLALLPRAPLATTLAAGVLLAFVVAPLALFVLNIFFGLPMRLSTMAFLAVALGMVAVAWRAYDRVLERASA